MLNSFKYDLLEFYHNNKKVLFVAIFFLFLIEFYFKSSNFSENLSILVLHILGDIFMIISIKMFSDKNNKIASIYLLVAFLVFISIGIIALFQGEEGKNYQYLISNIPFAVANIYQISSAWNLKRLKKIFNYKLNIVLSIVIVFFYYYYELVYYYSIVQTIGQSLFPIMLTRDMSNVNNFILSIFALFLMIIGAIIDLIFHLQIGILTSVSISTIFITSIAMFGFLNNSSKYYSKNSNSKKTNYILLKLMSVDNFLNKNKKDLNAKN